MCGRGFAQRLDNEAERMTTTRVQGHPLPVALGHCGTCLGQGQNGTLAINLDWPISKSRTKLRVFKQPSRKCLTVTLG